MEELSDRQRQVLLMRANGNSCTKIAKLLGITAQTVYEILHRVYDKYGAEDAPHAVAIAIAIGDIGIHEITAIGDHSSKAA